MAVDGNAAVLTQARENFPSFLRQYNRTKVLDAWMRGDQYVLGTNEFDHDVEERHYGGVFRPAAQEINPEFDDLATRAYSPWAGLIVTSLAQMVYVDGVRRPDSEDNLNVWKTWQQNEWDAVQISLHRSVIAHGLAYGFVSKAVDPLTGKDMARMSAICADEMAAFYIEDDDQWPEFALRCNPRFSPLGVRDGWDVRLIDKKFIHSLRCKGDGTEADEWSHLGRESHGAPVVPVVRYANRLDLHGRATGEIEPVIPMLRRIDQGTFDRLIVQRFGAWKIRYISGMAAPTKSSDEAAKKLQLRLEDFLVSDNPDTKFGTLDATDIAGFLEAGNTDLRSLAAISQTPPHHLLGVSSNLQAEALAAAEAGLLRKAGDFRTICGEAHEKMLRLTALMSGDIEEANAIDMQVQWRDTESRSLVQTVNALALAAAGLKIPVEMLWSRLPGWTDQDTERAKKLIENGDDLIETMMKQLDAELAAEAAKEMSDAVPPAPVVAGKATGGSDRGAKPTR